MSDLFTATREYDLPPKWDGFPIEWDGWESAADVRICPPPKPQPCPYCGSFAERVTNVGVVTVTGIPRIGSKRYPDRRRLYAYRCRACGHDQVYDFQQFWDLDLTDYQDEGSWSV